MEKATPGPWQVKNDYDERHIVIANIDGETFTDGTSSYSYDFVCDTYGDGDDDSRSMAVAIANARLIAAAPELLAACAEFLPILERQLQGINPGGAAEDSQVFKTASERVERLRAAIAKAVGR